jgi:hypothetical protein
MKVSVRLSAKLRDYSSLVTRQTTEVRCHAAATDSRWGVSVKCARFLPFDLRRCGDKLALIPPDVTKEENRDKQHNLVYHHILGICETVWPDELQLLLAYSKSHRHCIRCDRMHRRNDNLIPHSESMQNLTDHIGRRGLQRDHINCFRRHEHSCTPTSKRWFLSSPPISYLLYLFWAH